MAKQKGNMLRLGVLVTAGVLLFILGVYNVGNSKNLFGKNFTIHADFQNVSGLQTGNNVRFMGINIGSISKISIINDTTLRVKMLIEKSMQKNMKKDAIASIGTDGLVGGALVNIVPGKGNSSPVEDGDILKSKVSAEIGGMLNTLDGTNDNIATISLKLLEITEKINEGQGMIAALLNDANLVKDVNGSVRSIKKTGDNLETLSGELNQLFSELKEGKGILGYLLMDTTLTTEIEGTFNELDKMVDGDLKSTFGNLKQSSEDIKSFTSELNNSINDINTISNELKDLTRSINEGEGTLGMLLKDEGTEQQIQEIISNINESSIKLNENLEALKHNWFFRKGYKKKRKKERKEEG